MVKPLRKMKNIKEYMAWTLGYIIYIICDYKNSKYIEQCIVNSALI